MAFLDIIPLIGALVACLVGILILSNKNQNTAARLTLCAIVFLNAHNLFESYLYYNNQEWPGLGLSYVHYHLIGFLFLLYTRLLFRLNTPRWPVVVAVIGYTLLRLLFLLSLNEEILDRPDDFPWQSLILLLDYFCAILFNVILLVLAFKEIIQVKLAVQLSNREQLNFNWLKSLLILAIGTYLVMGITGVVSIFDEGQWLFYEKIESVYTSIFPLFIAFSAIRFPVFAVYGDFKDLPAATEKYLKSSLTSDEEDKIWSQVVTIMEEEEPYLNQEYRLNDLAKRIDRSLHHVSQVINNKLGVSFSDFINQHRVEKAQALLTSDRVNQVTILALAHEAGFNSKTAFYNTFRKFTGKTPSAFRKGFGAHSS